MAEQKERLTFLEAASTVAGYGIGAGIMAVPYLAVRSGVLPLLGIMVIAYLISILFHLMLVDMTMRDGGRTQLMEILARYLFVGKVGKVFTWVFFVLIVFAFFGTLITYLVGGGEVLNSTFDLPLLLGFFITYVLAAVVVFFGLKAVGIVEKFSIAGIAAVVITLLVVSVFRPFHLAAVAPGAGVREALALYGMVMFSFYSMFSIPQAVKGLSDRPRLAPWAVVTGIGITFCTVLLISLAAMGVSKAVTSNAIVGWSEAIGPWAKYLGSIFIILAFLTSFWSISLALADVLRERLKLNDKLAWLLATLPCLLISFFKLGNFIEYLRFTGGVIGILLVVIMIPGYLSVKKKGIVKRPAWSLGFFGKGVFLWIVLIGFLMMAVGSAIPIK
jgi:amino acid permease